MEQTQAQKDMGIEGRSFNGVYCCINQEAGTLPAEAYGEITGQYSLLPGGQYDVFQLALKTWQAGNREEAVKLIEKKFSVVTVSRGLMEANQ